jgi:pseudaminic acid cytidylyltransferase
MNLAVIPARGGSKRIPRKNVKSFCGRPMIAWSIAAAIESECFDRIIVSTDDEEIAEVAIGEGAEVPFLRPPELADDFTPTLLVVAHAVRWQSALEPVNQACCIYATAPFILPDDLRAARNLMYQSECEYVMAVTSYAYPIQRAIRLDNSGRVSMLQPEHIFTRSQDLEDAFHDAGQFYWGRSQAWTDQVPMIGPGTIGLQLPRVRVQDIDTPEDWQRAEYIFRAMTA